MTRAPGIGDSPPAPRAKGPVLPQKGGLPALSCVENAGSLLLKRSCCASWLCRWPCQVLRKGEGLSAVSTVPACFNKTR